MTAALRIWLEMSMVIFFRAPFVLLSSSDEPLENFFAKKKTKIIVRNQTIVNFDTKGIE